MTAIVLAASPALAQVCKEPGAASNGKANLDCDMSYRNTAVTCVPTVAGGVVGTHPPCPPQKMPMIDTPLKSYLSHYNPRLFTYPRDPDDPSRPYSGTYSIGTRGDSKEALQMFGKPVAGAKPSAACNVLLKMPGEVAADDLAAQARVNRLQMDSCTNEYILHWALTPFQDEIPMKLAGDDDSNPDKLADLASQCQPIKTNITSDDEYLPSDYLKVAWQKTLTDPGFRKNGDNKHEPRLPEGVTITNPVAPPDPFPEIRIAQLGAVQYEKINDPTHPFSPRWDYILNDREYSMPSASWANAPSLGKVAINYGMMQSYMLWPQSAVFCAGVRSENKLLKLANMYEKFSSMDVSSFENLNVDNLVSQITDKASGLLDKYGLDKIGLELTGKLSLDTNIMDALNKAMQGQLDALANLPEKSKALFEEWQSKVNLGGLEGIDLSKLTDAEQKLVASLQKLGKGGALTDLNVEGLADALKTKLDSVVNVDVDALMAKAESLKISSDILSKTTNAADLLKNSNISLETFSQAGATVFEDLTKSFVDPKKLASVANAGNELSTILGGTEGKFTDFSTSFGTLKDALGDKVDLTNVSSFSDFYQQAKTIAKDQNVIASSKDMIATAKGLGMTADTAMKAAKSIADNGASVLTMPSNPENIAAQSLMNALKQAGKTDLDITNASKTIEGLASGKMSSSAVMENFSKLKELENFNLPTAKLDSLMGTINGVKLKGVSIPDIGGTLDTFKNMSLKGYDFNKINVSLSATAVLGNAGITLPEIPNLQSAANKLIASGFSGTALASVSEKLKSSPANIFKAKSANNAKVPVDVLEFRRKPFEDALFARNGYNALCFADSFVPPMPPMVGPQAVALVAATSVCFQWGPLPPPAFLWAQRRSCWECFGNTPMMPVKDDTDIPCTLNYLGKDKKMDTQMPALEGVADAVLNLAMPFKPPGKIPGKIFEKLLKKAIGKIKFGLPTVLPGALNFGSLQAQCNADVTSMPPKMIKKRDANHNMDKVCADLRKPVTMINRLKMRYDNPSETPNNAMSEGVPEGMRFSDYFSNHMPYPRLWDTGASLQKVPTSDTNSQPPLDTTGQFTAIVGVGREGSPKAASDAAGSDASGKKAADKYSDQRCKTMGWGTSADLTTSVISTAEKALGLEPSNGLSFAGTKVTVPDPLTSWAELKLYQARAARNEHMNCLARYEKAFKPASAESLVLSAAGADWSRIVVTRCPKNGSSCDEISLKDYAAAGSPKSDSTHTYRLEPKNDAIPNTWRGYMASTVNNKQYQFPNFGGSSSSSSSGLGSLGLGNLGLGSLGGLTGGGSSSASKVTGMDNAQPGDVVLMPYGPDGTKDKPGLAKLALVVEAVTPERNPGCTEAKNCYVKVFEPDNGKFPDVCGNTDTAGEMKARYYYKPGSLPNAAKAEYERIKTTASCEESRISQCEMGTWDTLELYRIQNDRRKGCNKKSPNDC